MGENRRLEFYQAMEAALEEFIKQNAGILEARDSETVVQACRRLAA